MRKVVYYWHPKCRQRLLCFRPRQKSLTIIRKCHCRSSWQLLFYSRHTLACFGRELTMIFLLFFRYLKEFRTQQCPLFLQHKCTQHRPFTCFNWHFMNQRRRRPVRRRDGTFNYSPDIYCTKFDETTGLCPEGDEWVTWTPLDSRYFPPYSNFGGKPPYGYSLG